MERTKRVTMFRDMVLPRRAKGREMVGQMRVVEMRPWKRAVSGRDSLRPRVPIHSPCCLAAKRQGAKAIKTLERISTSGDLSPPEATMFRALSARVNYLAQDRPDLAFSTKELCR